MTDKSTAVRPLRVVSGAAQRAQVLAARVVDVSDRVRSQEQRLQDSLRRAFDTVHSLRGGVEQRHADAFGRHVVEGDVTPIPLRPVASEDLGCAAIGVGLDPDRLTVTFNGRRQRLTPTEWQLLRALCSVPVGTVLTRSELARRAWGTGYSDRNGQVEVYVSRVRRKIGGGRTRSPLIDTVRGRGYRLAPPPAA